MATINNNEDIDSPIPIATKRGRKRRSNSTYFIFYFFLWMFIGSLWILPPLLFNQILTQCDLSLLSCAILFCIYYVVNGVASLLSRFIINNGDDWWICACIGKGSHLLSSILIVLCILSLQFMSLTRQYLHQLIIWSVIGIVDGYLNNAAPVYLYRIYHIEASVMLTLCTIIAHFSSMIIAMSCIKSGSYRGSLHFISFLGVMCCLGLISLKSPSQKELIEAIKQCRNEIIEKKLETIEENKNQRRNDAYESSMRNDDDNRWHSMRNSVLFATRKESMNPHHNNNGYRSSISGTLSTYFHEHAPEMSFNPSVIHTINTANRDSHIQYPINAKLHCTPTPQTKTKTSFKSKSKVSELHVAPTPIMEESEETSPSVTSPKTSFNNTFASSNVRKIIAYSTNPPILAHSVNDSRCHTLEMIWKDVGGEHPHAASGLVTPPVPVSGDEEITPALQLQTATVTGSNTPHTQLSKLKSISTARSLKRVLFSENILKEEEDAETAENRLTFHSFNSPSTLAGAGNGNKTPDNPYWFDIEKRFESVSFVVSKRADTALASYIMNEDDMNAMNSNDINRKYSESFSATKSYDVTLHEQQQISNMKPIEEEEKKEKEEYNEIILNYLKKSKQSLFVLIVWITMIYSAQKVCYLTFITQYMVWFVGGSESIAVWLITQYLFGHLMARIVILFVFNKRYSAKNILLICQFVQFLNCLILLIVDWFHGGTPAEPQNKESRKFTKIMLFVIMFISGATSSPINVICFAFLNGIQSVTHFLSTIINITAALSNAVSIMAMACILNYGGIQTFPYYIMLILFAAIIIAIVINIKYMLFAQRLQLYASN